MARCECLVLIPNPEGENFDYSIVARTSLEAVQKAMEVHPHTIPFDAVITVIADGVAGAREHNARQPTFWHRAESVPAPVRPRPGNYRLN